MVNERKRGNVYEYNFDVAKIEGKRKRITKLGFKTKAEALKQGTIAYNEYLNTGRKFVSNEMSYSDFLDYWLDNHCKRMSNSVFDKKKNENGRWYIGTTKSKSGERQIHISQTLMKALVNFKNKQMELRILYCKDYRYYHLEEVKNQYIKVLEYQIVENQSNILSMKPDNLIFTRDNGKYCGTDIIKYLYKIIHDELGIENCRFYDLRGSYATTILRNGVEIRDVADVLGHKDIETTENYYISSTDETRKNVTDSYENAINLDVIEEIIEYKNSI